jgi:WD40 repeat protein
MDTNTTEITLKGHAEYISGIIQLEDGRICSCSDDKTIKVWSIESGQCELSIEGYTDSAKCIIQLIDRRLCSGSDDGTIRIWSKDTGVCELSISTGYTVYC